VRQSARRDSICAVTPVRIRQATVDDAEAVAHVVNTIIGEGYTLFDRPFTLEEERQFIASLGGRRALFAVELDGAIVGVQSIDIFVGFANSMRHVGTVGTWLLPEVRGRGVGRALATHTFDFARANGYEKVVIQVLAWNERALRFYRGLGFRDIGLARRHVKLGDAYHDEMYLELLL
jgi:RimJ/RimL family protein N-acetyltransferase